MNRDFVSADVLRDSACFAFGNVGGANGVEQRGFTVIDVAHDGDHRRTRQTLAGRTFFRGAASATSFAVCSSKVMTLVSAPKKRAISLASSASSDWLMVANTPRNSRRAIRSFARISSFSARSLTLMPSVMVMLRVIGSGSFETDEPRRRHEALHRAFFYSARNVALTGPARGTTGTAAGTRWSRRRQSGANANRTRPG